MSVGLCTDLPSNISEELKALVLMTPYDGASDSVALASRELFKRHIQNQSNVHSVFFQATTTDPNESNITSDFDFPGFAAVYASAAVGRVSSYKFGETINEQSCLDYMEREMSTDSWKKLGFELYSILFPVKVDYGGYNFQHFLESNKASWGQQLLDVVTSDPFLNTHISAITHNQWPDAQQQVNTMFFKLDQLGGQSLVTPAVQKWKSALEDKISVDYETFDYLNGSKPMNIEDIIGNAQTAINKKDTQIITRPPSPRGGPTIPTYIYTYGADVASFVNNWSRRMSVATGKKPDNVQYYTPNPLGCFLAGTKVHLSCGQDITIEEVRDGTKVLSHGGTVSTQTAECVQPLIPEGELIFGFNGEDPFFFSGHAFWTTEGWKAVSPLICQEENPDVKVGTLQVGDIVFQIAQVDPLLYQPVVIHRFTSLKLQQATTMHGLHLVGSRSYHANGYVVIMNYPMLTQKRLRDGFAKLNPEEKARLATATKQIVPELSKALGGFVSSALVNTGLHEPNID